MPRYCFLLPLLGAVFITCGTVLAKSVPCDRSSMPVAQPSVSPPALEATRKAPLSALLSIRGTEIRETSVSTGGKTEATVFAALPSRLVALVTVSSRTGSNVRQVHRHALPAEDAVAGAELRLTSFEALYALLMRQDPLSKFQMGDGVSAGPSPRPVAHAEALRRVATLRGCAAEEVRPHVSSRIIKPWRIASIRPLPARGQHGLSVSVRVQDESGKPLTGQVTFGRGVHLSCGATLSQRGEGTCTLFDSHGHDLHAHDRHGNNVATYSGIVTEEQIVLPTTVVFGGGAWH